TEIGLNAEAARELAAYLDDAQRALGAMPTQETLVAERFFDEAGGMQLVIHAPFGSRINKAWGLALRKRFCRQFNFELQAAATEDAILLSLGPQHSFPLADVFRYLHPATAKDILVQALLAAPVFPTRWRWNTTVSLAIPRNRGGRKVPPPLQRAMADDLMAAVFPDAAACAENIQGDRELPDHPLVKQVVRDCLEEAMDFEGLARVLERIHAGEITCIARDTTEPSPLAHEILNAKPYAFLDDAPLEERRTQAVLTRRTTSSDLGALDPAAIERVRDEERPDPRDADELHDALLTFGFLVDGEVESPFFDELTAAKRAGRVGELWVAAERAPEIATIHAIDLVSPRTRAWTREEAIVELLRGRLALVGPTTATALALSLGVDVAEADLALLKLESEGVVLRGSFESRGLEWCDRRLLARIHRYTLTRLRAEIEPVSQADFTRFLFAWQHATPSTRLTGIDGLRALLAQLDGFAIAERAWEKHVLPLRIDGYQESLLDMLCLSGEVRWARVASGIVLGNPHVSSTSAVSERAQGVIDLLRTRGPMFARDLDREALDELTRASLVTCDGFLGRGGRWSLLAPSELPIEAQAQLLLLRYGVVCRRLLARETNIAPWREL
ncbi:MAG TPA: ATP-dependent DNA helicase, partial [Thermoanaerobaculia bacterium]|nr:ATP-dependent DNA helicase [Thermoanaerobaculia bacterium]